MPRDVASTEREPVDVLLVDDREDKLLAAEAVLAPLGERLVRATSGEQALRHLLQAEVAVALLDVHMPGMDGFELARLLRGRERSGHTPIIFVTADEDEATLARAYALGAVDVVRAPVVPEVLRAKVAVFVELFRTRRQLEKEAARVRALNEELEAFTYSVSHDLRAPVRHVSGFVDLLRRRADAAYDDTTRRHLDTIARSAAHMGQLIDDLLGFARMGRTELMRTRVSLGRLVRELVAELRATGDVEWQVQDLPEVAADPSLLRVVLANLLGNALKYTRTRERPRIEVGARPADGAEVVVFVRDNGVGFDMQYADKLFGVFQRLHPAEDFEGTGIGLATVRRIVHRHGGRTWAEGEVDRGATFYFSLPEAKEGA
ncbi:MAG TPA: ATP-binding protein [Vicinamibacteria bacterium]|jgi:signal transduction histidine kinase